MTIQTVTKCFLGAFQAFLHPKSLSLNLLPFVSFPLSLTICLLPITSRPLPFTLSVCLLSFAFCPLPLDLYLFSVSLTSFPLPFVLSLYLLPSTSCSLPLAGYLFLFPTSFLLIFFCWLSLLSITFYAPLFLIIYILPFASCSLPLDQILLPIIFASYCQSYFLSTDLFFPIKAIASDLVLSSHCYLPCIPVIVPFCLVLYPPFTYYPVSP